MKFKYILPTVAILFATVGATRAQYTQDVFQFSQTTPGATSRIRALGNASTAIGGDMSSINRNPAGIGFFSQSEFSFTPEFDSATSKGTYFGQRASDNKNKLNFSNASVVFNTKSRVPKGSSTTTGLLSINIGLSWTRTNNFYENIRYYGLNEKTTVADFFANQGNIIGLKKAPQSLAYDQYLIDDDGNNGLVATPYLGFDQDMAQRVEGGQNEFNLAIGTNYSNKLYLGLGLGFANIRYNNYASFNEKGTAALYNEGNNNYDDVGYETFYDIDQRTTGSGFNFKLGLIYRPVESIRLGASFTSPTWYSIDDETTYILDTKYSDENDWRSGEKVYENNFNMRTPLRASGGVAVFFQQYGFITADVEYVDYEGMNISNTDDEASQNRVLSDIYKSTVNARFGAEGRLDPNFYLRAGYEYLSNPEKEIGGATTTISGGLGYRINNFYIDATYSQSKRDRDVYPYEIGINSPQAHLQKTYNNAYLTVGFRF